MCWCGLPPQATPHALARRLLDWSEEASRAGRQSRGDALLLLAWQAYDYSSFTCDGDGNTVHMVAPGRSQHMVEKTVNMH